MSLIGESEGWALHCGDFRDVLPAIIAEHGEPDVVIADPPYEETSLAWDRWPVGWPARIPGRSMWCFGSLRMLLERRDEFASWQLSHDVVADEEVVVTWEKHNGTGFVTDRFRRVHEFVTHWYRGRWSEIYHQTPRVPKTHDLDKSVHRVAHPSHTGAIRSGSRYVDDGLRLARSVIKAPSVRGGIHRTEKPVEVLEQLIVYGCRPGGWVFDPFAGSGSTLVAARNLGLRAIGVEISPDMCARAAERLSTSEEKTA